MDQTRNSIHQITVPPGFADVVILGTNSIRVGTGVTVGTDLKPANLVANDVSPGPVLDEGVELAVDKNAAIWGNASADSIDVDRGAHIYGAVACNDGSGVSCGGLGLPVFAQLPPFQISSPRPDAEDVLVGPGETVILPAGDYGQILVDQTATVVFAGGIYNIRELGEASTVGQCPFPCRTYLFESDADVRVLGKLKIGAASEVGPAPGSGISASDIVFYVGGINGGDGLLASVPAAGEIGQGSLGAANFYVPNGTLVIGKNSAVSGAFLARDVRVDKSTTVELDTYFFNQAPTADPLEVFTDGKATITITLTGSDPENDDLSFSIVPGTGPTEGTLGPVVESPPPSPGNPPGCTPDNGDGIPDPGECITDPEPPRTSATVDYTPATDENSEDSFTFQVMDAYGNIGMAVVLINPPGDETPPVNPVETVVAYDISAATGQDTTVTITLWGEAPCDPTGAADPLVPCDGIGDDAPLIFTIDSLPGSGTTANLVQGPGDPQRTATVDYTPNPGFVGQNDSFVFEACGFIGGQQYCDTATVTVSVVGLQAVAFPQELRTPAEVPVDITLSGLPGLAGSGETGDGTSAAVTRILPGRVKTAAFLDGAEVAGAVYDTDGDSQGDAADPLPGTLPELMRAGIDLALEANGSVSDSNNDATPSSNDDPDPDVVSATVSRDGVNLRLSVRYAAGGGFDPTLTRAQFAFDIDQDPGTGHAGSDSGCSNDNGVIGTEYIVNMGGPLGNQAEARPYVGPSCNAFGSPVLTGTVTHVADGMDAVVPLSAIGFVDGVMNFKVTISEKLAASTGNTGVLDYMPDVGTVGTVSATVLALSRMQIEWDISGLQSFASEIQSADVILHTVKGASDLRGTVFFGNDSDDLPDGQLSSGDFNMSVMPGGIAVMPVPAVATGTEGTFSFSILSELGEALGRDDPYFALQGRVDDGETGGGYGLQVRTSADGNLPSLLEPQLSITTPGVVAPLLTFSIVSLPSSGTLFDQLGTAILQPGLLPTSLVRYLPGPGFVGLDTFSFQVDDGFTTAVAGVSVVVQSAFGNCAVDKIYCFDGRP